MTFLVFSTKSDRKSLDLPDMTDLRFRRVGDDKIEIVTSCRAHVSWVPAVWRRRIQNTETDRIPPRAYLWKTFQRGSDVHAIILVATQGSDVANINRNPALVSELGRLMAPPPLSARHAVGAWASLPDAAEMSQELSTEFEVQATANLHSIVAGKGDGAGPSRFESALKVLFALGLISIFAIGVFKLA